jgi:hypothetical protein
MENARLQTQRVILRDGLHVAHYVGILELRLTNDIVPTLHETRNRRPAITILINAPVEPDRRGVSSVDTRASATDGRVTEVLLMPKGRHSVKLVRARAGRIFQQAFYNLSEFAAHRLERRSAANLSKSGECGRLNDRSNDSFESRSTARRRSSAMKSGLQ